jgi:hypothetical protein
MPRTVFVNDPSHHLWIGNNVWRRDITIRSQRMVATNLRVVRSNSP